MSSSAGVHEPAGHGDDLAPQRCVCCGVQVGAGEPADRSAEVVAMTARASQAPLAMNLPDGRCASPALFSLPIVCSTTACRRWSAASSGSGRSRSVTNAVVVPGGEQRQLRAWSRADQAHPAGVALVAGEHE